MSNPEVKRLVIKREQVESMLHAMFAREHGQYQTMAIHYESDGYGGYVIHGMVKVKTSDERPWRMGCAKAPIPAKR